MISQVTRASISKHTKTVCDHRRSEDGRLIGQNCSTNSTSNSRLSLFLFSFIVFCLLCSMWFFSLTSVAVFRISHFEMTSHQSMFEASSKTFISFHRKVPIKTSSCYVKREARCGDFQTRLSVSVLTNFSSYEICFSNWTREIISSSKLLSVFFAKFNASKVRDSIYLITLSLVVFCYLYICFALAYIGRSS